VVAVYKLLDFREAKRIFKVRRIDGYALLLTFVLTLLLGIEEGVLIGALFALLVFIRRTAYPHIAEMGYVEKKEAFLSQESFPEGRIYSEALIIRFDSSFYYANVPYLEEWLIKEVADRPRLKWIVIDCRSVNSIDVTAIEGLEDLIRGYRSRHIEILFTHMKLSIRRLLKRAGWDEKFGDATHPYHYQTTREALRDIGLLEENDD
jgi:SulP family sulfate permease